MPGCVMLVAGALAHIRVVAGKSSAACCMHAVGSKKLDAAQHMHALLGPAGMVAAFWERLCWALLLVAAD